MDEYDKIYMPLATPQVNSGFFVSITSGFETSLLKILTLNSTKLPALFLATLLKHRTFGKVKPKLLGGEPGGEI